MKDLWNRSFELFRRRVILWVPCSIAAVVMLSLSKLQKSAIYWAMEFFARQRSVLGGEVPFGNLQKAEHQTRMLMFPLGVLKSFIEVCCFVVAMIATKNLVQMILDNQAPNTTAAMDGVRQRIGEIAQFSMKYMAVLAVSGGVLVVMGSSPLTSDRIHGIVLSRGSIYLYACVLQACLAWLLLPAAIRLLRPLGNPPVTIEERQRGTVFALSTAICAITLEYLVNKVEANAIFEQPWERSAVAVANILVINMPQVLLFIALTLLARGQSEDASPEAEPETA